MSRLLTSFVLLSSVAVAGSVSETPEAVVALMEQRNLERHRALGPYQGRRRYFADHKLLSSQTYLVVEERFQPPEDKQFRVLERGGSRELEAQVFKPLIEAEQVTARSPEREATDICRRNYAFRFIRYDAAERAYIFEVDPRTSNRYLFRGRIWIDDRDFAVRRIEGEPAQPPSYWVRSTRFVHEFAKFGGMWLPVRHRSEVELRLFGRATMGIDYFDYHWQPQPEKHP